MPFEVRTTDFDKPEPFIVARRVDRDERILLQVDIQLCKGDGLDQKLTTFFSFKTQEELDTFEKALETLSASKYIFGEIEEVDEIDDEAWDEPLYYN